MRSVSEWIGKNDDSRIPNRVRIRVFERYGGCCYRSGSRIFAGDKWAIDHIIALANGGRHAETNLAPILVQPHKEKTKADRKIQSKIYKIKKRHLGLNKPKRKPMMGTKASGWKRTMSGKWERRS